MKIVWLMALMLCGCVPTRMAEPVPDVFAEVEPEPVPEVEQVAAEKIAVIVWMAPFPCEPCERLKREVGLETEAATVEYRVGPPPWIDQAKKGSGYPYYEWTNSAGWLYSWGYRSADKFNELIRKGAKEMPVEWKPIRPRLDSGPIVWRVQQLREAIGSGAIRLEWKRARKTSWLASKVPTLDDLLTESGSIDLDEIDTEIVDLSASYQVTPEGILVDVGPVLVPTPDLMSQSYSDQRCGSVTVWTILSAIQFAYQLLTPSVSCELDEVVAITLTAGEELKADIAGMRGSVRWSFLYGLWRPTVYADVSSIAVGDEAVTVRLRSRLCPVIRIPI